MILPRLLDKCRALLAGKNAEYNYNCPLDKRFLGFTGIDPEALKAEVGLGKGDGEILAWIQERVIPKRTDVEVAAWSSQESSRVSGDAESRGYFQEIHQAIAPSRADIYTWFDLLDLDDYVSYGGKA